MEVRDIPPNANVYREKIIEFAREHQNYFLSNETITNMLISDERDAGGNRDVLTIWEDYLRRMSKPGVYATELIVVIAAAYFGKNIRLIKESYVTDWHPMPCDQAVDPPFAIVNIGDNHFQSVHRLSLIHI